MNMKQIIKIFLIVLLSTQFTFAQMININTATEKELTMLPGIGKSRAKAIINYRIKHGDFTNINELININGIGKVIFNNIKNQVKIEAIKETIGENEVQEGGEKQEDKDALATNTHAIDEQK